ncbi:MAG: aspartoacylase [Bacteriovoracaceae bacterium]|nr:aspartoacylase [Bacteriovoracaceae bacterium]
MNFAIIGGTHGNEPVGIEVIRDLEQKGPSLYTHEFKTFVGNPKAFEIGKRYVNSDLNRAFGELGNSSGNESKRSEELDKEIRGKFDFLMDLHTTTSNMGITIILTHLDETTIKAACYLKEKNPELVIIVSSRAGTDCPYTTNMAPSALTVEVGPVANNVVKADLVFSSRKLVTDLLDFDFKKSYNLSQINCFHTQGILSYPEGKWMVHPEVDGHDFREVKNGDSLFININGDIVRHEGESIFPLFINEAAYQENNTAMEYAVKTTLDKVLNR